MDWACRGAGGFGARPWLKYESAGFILAVATAARLGTPGGEGSIEGGVTTWQMIRG
jgi:hypothetical protein